MYFLPLAFLLLFGFSNRTRAESEIPSEQPVVDDRYAGGYKNDYYEELAQVRQLASKTQQEVATRLGLFRSGRGFSHPVTIRFSDGAPASTENPFFNVETKTNDKEFSQELRVDVEAFARHRREPQ